MMMQIETTGVFAPTVAYTGARSFGAASTIATPTAV